MCSDLNYQCSVPDQQSFPIPLSCYSKGPTTNSDHECKCHKLSLLRCDWVDTWCSLILLLHCENLTYAWERSVQIQSTSRELGCAKQRQRLATKLLTTYQGYLTSLILHNLLNVAVIKSCCLRLRISLRSRFMNKGNDAKNQVQQRHQQQHPVQLQYTYVERQHLHCLLLSHFIHTCTHICHHYTLGGLPFESWTPKLLELEI